MRALLQLQEAFVSGLNNPANALFLQEISPHAKVLPQVQFTIYRNSILGRFQKALQDIYPVCHRLVGHDFFMAMATAYIEQTPSHSPDLNEYGQLFADFILAFQPANSLPYLCDVARLEWAWQRLTGAPVDLCFDFDALTSCYEQIGESIVFALPPRSTLLTSPYPVHHIFEANQKDSQDSPTIFLESNQRYCFLIWRKQHELRIDCVDFSEWQILNWLQSGYTLGELTAEAAILYPETDIAALLSHWVAQGWIANFTF
jgi:hypothetical protein